MPAAAVIPAPIAYIKVAAVKKLVVGFCGTLRSFGLPQGCTAVADVPNELILAKTRGGLHWSFRLGFATFTLKKLECSKRGIFA